MNSCERCELNMWTMTAFLLIVESVVGSGSFFSNLISLVSLPLFFVLLGKRENNKQRVNPALYLKNICFEYLLPTIISFLLWKTIVFVRENPFSFGSLVGYIADELCNLVCCKGTEISIQSPVYCLWILYTAFICTLIWHFLSVLAGDRAAISISIVLSLVGYYFASCAIRLPFFLDVIFVEMLFFSIGACFKTIDKYLYSLCYWIVPFLLLIWCSAAFYKMQFHMAERNYSSILCFPVSAAGILGLWFAIRIFSSKNSDFMSGLGWICRYPTFFVSAHLLDMFFARWWQVSVWYISALYRFLITLALSVIILALSAKSSILPGDYVLSIKEIKSWYDRYYKSICACFYICFSIVYSISFYRTTMFREVTSVQLASVISYLDNFSISLLWLLGSLELLKETEKKRITFQAGILAYTFFYKAIAGGTNDIIILCLLAVAISNKHFQPILRISLAVGSVIMIASYYASMNQYIEYLVYDRGKDILAHAFGIIYRTDFAAHVLYLMLAYVAIRKRNITLIEYGFLTLTVLFVNRYSQARINTLAMTVLIIMSITMQSLPDKFIHINVNRLRWPITIAHIACGVISYILVFVLGSKPVLKLDSYGHRLQLSKQAFDSYQIRLFGQSIAEHAAGGKSNSGAEYFFIDIAYIRVLFVGGVFLFIIYLSMMTYATYKCVIEGKVYLALVLTAISVVSMVEHHSIEICYNIFALIPFSIISIKSKDMKGPTTENITGSFDLLSHVEEVGMT